MAGQGNAFMAQGGFANAGAVTTHVAAPGAHVMGRGRGGHMAAAAAAGMPYNAGMAYQQQMQMQLQMRQLQVRSSTEWSLGGVWEQTHLLCSRFFQLPEPQPQHS